MRIKFFLLLTIIGSFYMNTIFAAVASKNNQIVPLPKPVIEKDFSLDLAIEKRRSVRSFRDKDLTLSQISQLLWAAQGITDSRRSLRATPSAGALYPLQLYLVKSDGLWVYLPKKHALKKVSGKNMRNDLTTACLGQGAVRRAPISIVITADYSVIARKYGDRAKRYTHFEVGHAAQNILLEAVSLGLGAVPIGACRDSAIDKLFGLPKNLATLYVIPIGQR